MRFLSYVWHNRFKCVDMMDSLTWLIHMCSHVWHDPLTRVTWVKRTCLMSLSRAAISMGLIHVDPWFRYPILCRKNVQVWIYKYTCIYIHTYIYILIQIDIYLYTYAYVDIICLCRYNLRGSLILKPHSLQTWICIYKCMNIYVYTHIYVCMCIYINRNMYTHM